LRARSLGAGWRNRVRGVRGHDLMSVLEDWAWLAKVTGTREDREGRGG